MQELLEISAMVLVIELVIILGVAFGWWYGARRLNLKLHHGAVYLLVLVHLLTVGLWMIPRSLAKLVWYLPTQRDIGILFFMTH